MLDVPGQLEPRTNERLGCDSPLPEVPDDHSLELLHLRRQQDLRGVVGVTHEHRDGQASQRVLDVLAPLDDPERRDGGGVVRPAGPQGVEGHPQRVLDTPDLAALLVVPADRDLGDRETHSGCSVEDLHVEGETVDGRHPEEEFGDRGPVGLEAALGVAQGEPGELTGQHVVGTTHHRTVPRRPLDLRAVHRPGADRDVGGLQGEEEFVQVGDLRRGVGIDEGDLPSPGRQDAGTHRGALASVLLHAQATSAGAPVQTLRGHVGGGVGAAVVDHQDLGLDTVEMVDQPLQGGRETVLLVVRGHDHRQGHRGAQRRILRPVGPGRGVRPSSDSAWAAGAVDSTLRLLSTMPVTGRRRAPLTASTTTVTTVGALDHLGRRVKSGTPAAPSPPPSPLVQSRCLLEEWPAPWTSVRRPTHFCRTPETRDRDDADWSTRTRDWDEQGAADAFGTRGWAI